MKRVAILDFCDVPRLFAVALGPGYFILYCPFDEAIDDYPDEFSVYEASPPSGRDARNLPPSLKSARLVGKLSVTDLGFDRDTRRTSIDARAMLMFAGEE